MQLRKIMTLAAAFVSVQAALATTASDPQLAQVVKACETDARVLADHFFKAPGGRPSGDTVDARVVADAAFERMYFCVDKAVKLQKAQGGLTS